jgi:TolB-like protein
VVISNAVFEQVRDRVPDSFEDLGDQQVKNIARPVRAFRLAWRPTPASPTAMSPLPLPDKPSIAVLPFANMSGDPEQEYFADGMVEEIITALSRIRWLFLIARNSSFTYQRQAVDVKRVGRELGVRYLLEGSVRKAGDRVRITAQLIDATNGAHLWADRFDGSLEDVFELQDKVASSVAGVIEPALKSPEIRRSSERPTADLTAYDFYLRALHQARSNDRDGYSLALNLLEQATRRDPNYVPVLSLAAFYHQCLHVSGWTDEPERTRRDGVELAQRTVRDAGGDAEVLGRAAYVLGYVGEDIEAAIALIGRSVELNPSFAPGWYWSGWLRLWAGQPDKAIEHFETALRLNPRDPHPSSLQGIGVGHFFARRFEEAKAMLLRSLQQLPAWAPSYRFLAACCAHLGQREEAREMIEELRALTPLVLPSADHWRNGENREPYLSGLRLAAGERR